MKDGFFVGIYDPIDVRRNLLENSKEIVKSLQYYDKLKEIRSNKLMLFQEMKTVMEELDLLVTKLKEKLPKSHLRKVQEEKEKHSPEKFSSELDQLEKQLRIIENELSGMDG
ncbi:hypothetical protein JXC34_06115 [Candidatus Woesearchaeota archaeon]|nr:hypothetical protein [Candidatus Woesearchaeota archaeon]